MRSEHGNVKLQEKSTTELLRTLSSQVATLVHQEVELAKTEVIAKSKKFGRGAGIFGAAGIVGAIAGPTLIAAAIAGIATALPVWLSILIMGAGLTVVAGVLGLIGLMEVSEVAPPVPQQALESSKEDVSWLRTQARSAKP